MKLKYMNSRYNWFLILPLVLGTIFFPSCKKFIAVDAPKTQLTMDAVFDNDATALAALVAIYYNMIEKSSSFGSYPVTLYAGLSADEFKNYSTSPDQVAVANNTLQQTNSIGNTLWTAPYGLIYQANALIEGIPNATKLTPSVKQQIMSEAKFMRAFFHFYLLNFYGHIPYITTTDYRVNAVIGQEDSAVVYQKIITDLKEAQESISVEYPGMDRARPNRAAVTALLARVYLYRGEWALAEAEADKLLNSNAEYRLEKDLTKVFRFTSPEVIWQIRPVIQNAYNSWEALNFLLEAAPSSITLSDNLLNAFEAGDERKNSWVGSIDVPEDQTYLFPFKYNTETGQGGQPDQYSVVFRLGEQYLIRAEARANQGDLINAVKDVDSVRARADLPLIINTNPGISKTDLLIAIEHERRIELFAEWGHRWFDLKRTKRADAVIGALKPSTWSETDKLYPIPFSQISTDPNMDQSPGY